jgi:D-lyxose ketol-isomerase
MLKKQEYEDARNKAIQYFEKAAIVLTEDEKLSIEVADFGFGDLKNIGLEVLVYVNTDRVCAKELIMFPNQTCPEHIHPIKEAVNGKEETFRCRWGEVILYVPREKCKDPKTDRLGDYSKNFTVFNEIILKPGEQYTLTSDTLHWFRAGGQGAVVSEFSTASTDEQDIFTDPRINRFTKVFDE